MYSVQVKVPLLYCHKVSSFLAYSNVVSFTGLSAQNTSTSVDLMVEHMHRQTQQYMSQLVVVLHPLVVGYGGTEVTLTFHP